VEHHIKMTADGAEEEKERDAEKDGGGAKRKIPRFN